MDFSLEMIGKTTKKYERERERERWREEMGKGEFLLKVVRDGKEQQEKKTPPTCSPIKGIKALSSPQKDVCIINSNTHHSKK